jgi:hypothetical protein
MPICGITSTKLDGKKGARIVRDVILPAFADEETGCGGLDEGAHQH